MTRRPGPASELLALECERLERWEKLRGERVLTDVALQCRQPLQVMVAGDVSAGKSTLINALLGQALAEVGRPETTAYLTWYRHPGLAGNRVPGDRNRAVEERFPLADRISLLDSPGLNTTSHAQRATLDMLSGRGYDAGAAAALVFVVVGAVSALGYHRIAEFDTLSSGGLGSLGNIILVAGKAETVRETSARDPAARTETIEQSARKTEGRLRAGRIPVRPVAVSQHLAMVARCGAVTAGHVDLVRDIVDDPDLRRFAAYGWEQLGPEWTARGRALEELSPLRKLFPSLGWLPAELPDAAGLNVAALSACCERVSRLGYLERALGELAEEADLLTVTAASQRLRRWAKDLGQHREPIVTERLTALWARPELASFPCRQAVLLLRTSLMRRIPEADRVTAIALLRRELPAGASPAGESWADFARRWHLMDNSALYGPLAADVARRAADAAIQHATRPRGAPCPNTS